MEKMWNNLQMNERRERREEAMLALAVVITGLRRKREAEINSRFLPTCYSIAHK